MIKTDIKAKKCKNKLPVLGRHLYISIPFKQLCTRKFGPQYKTFNDEQPKPSEQQIPDIENYAAWQMIFYVNFLFIKQKKITSSSLLSLNVA